MKMPLSKFAGYTTAGCLLWDIVLIYAGMFVGANWRVVAGAARYLIIAAAVAIVITLAFFIFRRKKRKAFTH